MINNGLQIANNIIGFTKVLVSNNNIAKYFLKIINMLAIIIEPTKGN